MVQFGKFITPIVPLNSILKFIEAIAGSVLNELGNNK